MDDRLNRRRLVTDLTPPADASPGAGVYVGKVYSGGSIPATLPGYFLTHPVTVGGTQSEGSTPTLTTATGKSVVVLVVGTTVPAVGDTLLARLVGQRWVAEVTGGTPPACGRINRTVRGCNGLNLPGATVTLRDAALATVATGTTNSSGVVSFLSVPAGTYSLVVSKSRFNSATVSSLTVNCTTSPTLSGTTTLSVASGYVCCSACVDPIADTLFATDANGTHTLSWNGSSWQGSYVQSGVSNTVACAGSPCSPAADEAVPQSRVSSVKVWIGLFCPFSAGSAFTLAYDSSGANVNGYPAGYMPVFYDTSCDACGVVNHISSPSTVTGGSTCGLPFSQTFSVSSGWQFPPPTGASRTGPVSGTVTVTE